MKVDPKKAAISGGLIIMGLLMVFLVITAGRGLGETEDDGTKTIKVRDGEVEITVSSDGSYKIINSGESSEGFWSKGKALAFLDYFYDKYGENSEYLVSGDELVQAAVSGGSSGGEDGGDIGQYFDDGDGDGSGGGPGGGPGSTPTPAPGGGSDECLYWRLSYCVRRPAPTPTPSPSGEIVAFEPTCGDQRNLTTGRTVIGNELCVDPAVEQ